jgi:UPF0288 family protein (methanogenesis marker protein 3)
MAKKVGKVAAPKKKEVEVEVKDPRAPRTNTYVRGK